MRLTGNWSPAFTDRDTDFFLGPPALRPAAPFFTFPVAPLASMVAAAALRESFGGGKIGESERENSSGVMPPKCQEGLCLKGVAGMGRGGGPGDPWARKWTASSGGVWTAGMSF